MSNPYQSPKPNVFAGEPGGFANAPTGGAAGFSMVNQVTMVSVFLIIQGLLATIMGLVVSAYGIVLAVVLPTAGPPGQAPPEGMATFMLVTFSIIAVLTLVTGVLQIVAGIRNLKFRGRTLGLVAMFSGLVQMMTCYCLPTAIALLVYGLIIYLNESVKEAFAMGEQGVSREQIMHAFWQQRPVAPVGPLHDSLPAPAKGPLPPSDPFQPR